MAWVEGLTNSQRILYTLANILTTSNKVLERRWRKNVDGKPVDFVLTDTGANVWKDASGNTVSITDYTEVWVPSAVPDTDKNWEVIYATGGAIDLATAEVNLTANDTWETYNGFQAKRIILKTKTTPITVDASYDEYNTDPDSRVDSIDMFLEIIKYKYAINPESNLTVTAHPVTGAPLEMENNHYIEMRYGDLMEIAREYVVDKATQTEQADKVVIDGVINKSTLDTGTGTYTYTALSASDAALYEIKKEYGDRLLEKNEGGHPSEYAKYSWYLDYKEQLVDELDGGPSSDDISKGIALVPQIISGMTETIPIQFWINCDNDRVSMVLMGDPTIDYDKYLTSFCYLGKIDSFDGDGVVNDTAGNFALTVGSSTIPAKRPTPLIEPMNEAIAITKVESTMKNLIEIGGSLQAIDSAYSLTGYYLTTVLASSASTIKPPDYVNKYRASYKFVGYSKDDMSNPSIDFDIVYTREMVDSAHRGVGGAWDGYYGRFSTTPVSGTTIPMSDAVYKFTLRMPKNTKSIKVYKAPTITSIINNPAMPPTFPYGTDTKFYKYAEVDLTTATGVTESADGQYLIYTWSESTIDGTPSVSGKPLALTKDATTEKSVLRDKILGFVTGVVFSTVWGEQTTATGVNDISMFKTRSGVFNQRHYSSFITPEEYMRKDAFNPSRWTGKFHLSPTYIVHGYDGYRGWLKDTVIVDNTSIVHLDELIVNKDSRDENKPQEIYKYFKLNAPFSFLNNSPNFNYGIGILKSKTYTDNKGNKITLF